MCAGLNATYQQQIVSVHNDLRRRVAQGLETLGAPGPQPAAANMREFVSNILLALHQCANNCSNTGFYCKWRSRNRISHCILILQFMESRMKIGIGQRLHYLKEKHMYLGRRSDIERRTGNKMFYYTECRYISGAIASRSLVPEATYCTVVWCP